MVGSITITVSPKDDIKCLGLGGEALHGFFYNVLKTHQPALAARLHRSTAETPFTLSPFLESVEIKEGYCFLKKDKPATFRLTFLDEEILTATVAALFNTIAQGTNLEFCGKPVSISQVNLQRGKMVSFTSFDKILAEAKAEPIVTLEFFSPTCFKAGKTQMLFPEPRLVFSSLLKKWNAFSTSKIPPESIPELASIKVASYDLHTSLVRFSNYKIIGSMGRITYELPRGTPQVKALNALADFAFYAGTGAKTTMGMGQTRRLK